MRSNMRPIDSDSVGFEARFKDAATIEGRSAREVGAEGRHKARLVVDAALAARITCRYS